MTGSIARAKAPWLAALLGTVAITTAQRAVPGPDGPNATQGQETSTDAKRQDPFELDHPGAGLRTIEVGDYQETHVQGGFRYALPTLGLTLRGENLLILNDLETMRELMQRNRSSGLPTRGIASPEPRRRLSPQAIRQRLQQSLTSIGRSDNLPTDGMSNDALRLFRYLYCEGDIVVIQNGVEVMRCDRMWISPIDDRIVVDNAELRYVTKNKDGLETTMVVRGPRLTKQGGRWVGKNVVLTTCTAAKPHFGLASGEVEIIERPGEFEVISRDQTLQIGGTSVLPLPDARIFTGSQSEFPIKRASVGYSGNLGAQLGVTLGLPWNETGGKLHNWLTGRPASEFRGEWEFGVGWIQRRGVPIEGALTYGAEGLYEGRTEAFYLNDRGKNLREISTNIDGSLINNNSRGLLRTQNRLHFGENTHLDLVAFHASDASVYSEFFMGPYRNDELPETSTYLHHADGNHLLTVGSRFNLNDFSFRDDRYLAPRFVEELPVMTYQWLAQPIAETPWETPIVLDLETQIGQRRSDFDDRFGSRISDRTLRADQHLELSTPFHIGALNIRPYANARGTFYDQTPSGLSEERVAMEAGFQIGTRMSRTWSWFDEDGKRDAVRHVIAPRLTYRNRYHVDDQPGSFFQFDNVNPIRQAQLGYSSIDLLTERELVRFEIRNLVQKMGDDGHGGQQPRDFIFLDIAQDFLPNDGRDNRGETLGLFFYDLLLRPQTQWLPFDNFALALYGDLDWARGMQTLDTELQFGEVLGVNWTIEYREDARIDGAVALAGSTQLFDRWSLFASAQRDLEQDEWLSYAFGLQRNDHDWSIAMSALYNPFIKETTFRIEFLPRFGGLTSSRGRTLGDPRNRYSFDY